MATLIAPWVEVVNGDDEVIADHLGVASIADVHLCIWKRMGRLFLRGVKPSTGIHAVTVGFSDGYPSVKLLPMV